jgi:hypothetical protein
MTADDEAVVELEQEVLPDGARRQEPPPVDRGRDRRSAWMRRLSLDALAYEQLEPARRAMEAVALGHYSTGRLQSAARRCSRTTKVSSRWRTR